MWARFVDRRATRLGGVVSYLAAVAVVSGAYYLAARFGLELLYQDGPGGTLVGASLGHTISEGGANRGEFTIAGISPKKILASRRFRVEATGQKITVKGKRVICKRGVSVQFPADFG